MYKTLVWAHETRVIIKNKLDSPFSCFFFSFFSFFPMVELKLKNLPLIKTIFFILFYYLFLFLYILFIIIIIILTNSITRTKLGVDSCPSSLRFD